MKEKSIEIVLNKSNNNKNIENISFLNMEQSKKAIQFHKSFSVYDKTPLVCLNNLAKKLNADAFLRCDEYVAADGMRILAAPIKEDRKVVSGESGAAAFGCMANILQYKEWEYIKDMLKLDKNSKILCISTEGDTDAQNYKDIVWSGKYSKFE